MPAENRAAFKAGVTAAIYTNSQRLITGDILQNQFLVMADSVVFISDGNTAGGYLQIDATNSNVDVSFIKSTSPSGKFLMDNGTWANLTDDPLSASFLFVSGQGIDTTSTSGSDVLHIGTANADVINYGNSSTVHNFFGTAIYEEQTNSYVKDKVITLNFGGSSASGGDVGFEIQEADTITGSFKTNSSRNGFSLLAPAIAYTADLNINLLTANRAFSFPDAAGTFLVGSLSDGGIAFGASGALSTDENLIYDSSNAYFKVNGSALFGLPAGSNSPTALVDIAAASTSRASLRIRATSSTPTSPNVGDIWQTGTDIFIHMSSGTHRFSLV